MSIVIFKQLLFRVICQTALKVRVICQTAFASSAIQTASVFSEMSNRF